MSIAIPTPLVSIKPKPRVYPRGNFFTTTTLAVFCSAAISCAQTLPSQPRSAPGKTVVDAIFFNISAQPLTQALSAFSRQSGMQVFQPIKLNSEIKSDAVVGLFAAVEGLRKLLGRSGISFKLVGTNRAILDTHAIASNANATVSVDSATTLETIRVRGSASSNAAANEVFTQSSSSVYISSEELTRYAHISAGDLLKGQPGVQVGDTRNGGGLDVNIRGVQGQNRVAVTVDGTQQSLDTYRGYAGTQQRSYIDPDLVSDILITKGSTVAANAAGAIGGTVEMQTIGVNDVLNDGRDFGIRIKGDVADNGIEPQDANSDGPQWQKYNVDPRDRENLSNFDAKNGSVALAYASEYFDLVGAYALREQGNYFAGSNGRERYRAYIPMLDDEGTSYLQEVPSVANIYRNGEEVLNTSSRTESVLWKATIKPTDEQTLDLGYRYFDGHFGEIMPSVILRGQGSFGQWPEGAMEIESYHVRYAYHPSDITFINLKINAWTTNAMSEMLNGGPMTPKSQRSDFSNDYGWARYHNQRWGIDVSNRSEFDTSLGSATLDLSAAFMEEVIEPARGVVITQDDFNENRFLRDGDLHQGNFAGQFTINPTDTLSLRFGGRYTWFQSQDSNRTAETIYEQKTFKTMVLQREDEWVANAFWFADADGQFTDGTNPVINNGTATSYADGSQTQIRDLQYQSVEVSEPQTDLMPAGHKFGQRLSRKDRGFAPIVGATYNLTEDSLVYVNYSEGLRMPGLFESSLGTVQLRSPVDLKPERSRTWEIGASTSIPDLLTSGSSAAFKVAYFDTAITDYITRYYKPGGDGLMFLTNAQSYNVSGLEVQGNYDGGRFFTDLSATYYLGAETCDPKWAAQLRGAAGLYVHTEDTPNCTAGSFSGSYANTQNPPKYGVNVTTGVRFFDEALTIGGRLTYTSGPIDTLDKPWQKDATAAQVLYQPAAVVDVFASYKLRENADLNLSVQNIANRYYLDPLAQSLMPAPGRTFRAALTMKF